ncbi:arsenate reductase (Arc2) [Penicillium cosmopolitanum]|uniref:Arsenate reductase (Arc2) n=1 Tax=Penicillium cosmopolitanum TaxID=1131564 RepID=A0A9X0BDA2_9EURO|nr:arsenate reductase (Arc2) [Penicillium cosmopolitanum]KAJ5408375.1 arsenate reductase (Arc2) [Penicillium cosmopolitanum]
MAALSAITSDEPARPWHAAYPTPLSQAAALPRQELLQWLEGAKVNGKDFVLVDLRRDDYKGGTIRGSLNLPAQSLYPTLSAFYDLVSSSGVKNVVFYCGSCGGRGTRSAGWFADHLQEVGDSSIQSMILEGGIKGWAAAGPEYTALMDEFDASVWKK